MMKQQALIQKGIKIKSLLSYKHEGGTQSQSVTICVHLCQYSMLLHPDGFLKVIFETRQLFISRYNIAAL